MKPKFFILTLFWTIAAQALCQYDTIGSDYRFYYPPISDVIVRNPDYIPGVCRVDGCTWLLHDLFFDADVPDIHESPISIGFIADQEFDILGLSLWVAFSNNINIAWATHFFQIGIPNGNGITNVRDTMFAPEEFIINKTLRFYNNYHNHAYYHGLMEFMFDSPYHVDEGDTIFIGHNALIPQQDNPDVLVPVQQIPAFYEMHGPSYAFATSDFHLPEYLYRTYYNGDWVSGTLHIGPLIWAIVRFPDDTCPAPQELRATAIGEGTEFLQFDTMGNHAAWEISYGPSGTAPDDGTVVQTTIPQAVIGNLDPTTRYVAYCRARCDFARSEWSPWSDSIGFTPSLASIDDAARPQLSLAPNPAHGKVRIACSHAMQAVTLIAADGSTALTLHPDAAEATIDLHALPAGTYTVVAATAAGIATKKLTTW